MVRGTPVTSAGPRRAVHRATPAFQHGIKPRSAVSTLLLASHAPLTFLHAGNGDSFDVTLPQNLSPGGYLIRHEIIGLHLADTVGGAEYYPSCTQIRVGGDGTGAPSDTVSFPGAYSASDPGIKINI